MKQAFLEMRTAGTVDSRFLLKEGKTYVNIREFYLDKNMMDMKPDKKGISLNTLQYQQLKSVMEKHVTAVQFTQHAKGGKLDDNEEIETTHPAAIRSYLPPTVAKEQ